MRTNKNRTKIILAVTVALLATMISYSVFSNMKKQLTDQKQLIDFMQSNPVSTSENFAYATATKDLKAGEIVAEGDVDFKNFTAKNSDAFENRSDIVNKILLQDITSGETFTSKHIAKISADNMDLREGYRALTLPAENFQGKSSNMKEGGYVDIYSAASDSNWLLENTRILSMEKPEKTADGKPTTIFDATAITFEVAANEIPDFITNVSKNKLVLVTRGAKDIKKATAKKHNKSIAHQSSGTSLPNLPSSVPITDLSGEGLPDPTQPEISGPSVEVIEANVKTKVTFD